MSASKRPREDDDDLWGDELDANTVDECFFLASQAMSQNAPTEAHTTKEDAQPTSSLFCKPADTKFKVPQPISHFKPKQRLSDSSSSPSSAFTKKFPSTAPSQLFPKKVSASASQSHTFPQQRQYTPTQLDVHKKSSPNVFPKMVSASKSVTKFPSTSGVLSTSKSSATVRSVTPSWPQPNSAGSSKLPGSSSTDRQPRTSWSASASAGSSCSTETNHVRSMGALSSIGGKMTIPTKPEGNVSLSTPVPEEIDFRMTSTRGTVHMLNTNSFPTAGSSKGKSKQSLMM
ncbi:hypothetical protein C0J52_06993 [Blattella germanica]|nr:hypothetical protein C0J52_06993 [Blattella germanica]